MTETESNDPTSAGASEEASGAVPGEDTSVGSVADEVQAPRKTSLVQRGFFLVITVLCFVLIYNRVNGAAQREGLSLVDYMSGVFATVDWLPWLALMMVYSFIYFAIDTLVVTRALGWFIQTFGFSTAFGLAAGVSGLAVPYFIFMDWWMYRRQGPKGHSAHITASV